MAETKVHDPAVAFRFEVQARGANLGFSKVGGLKDETDVIEYREGADEAVIRKIPGLRKFEPIVCERGMTSQGRELIKWRDDVIACKGPDGEGFRSTLTVTVKNCDGTAARVVKVGKAWPSLLEISDLDAKSSEVNIEMVQFQHEGVTEQSVFTATA